MSRPSYFASPVRIAKFAALAWACLLLLLHAGPLAAEDPTADMPYRRVYVPSASVRSMAQGHMPLRREEFEQLVETLRDAAAEPPGLATPIPRAVYHARLEGDRLGSGTAVWRIEPSENAPALLNLSGIELPILEPYWNGNPAEKATVGWADDTGLVLLTPAAGDLHFAWSHAGDRAQHSPASEGPLDFQLHLPPAGRTTLFIDVPQGWDLRASEGGAVVVDLPGDQAANDRLLASLAPSDLAEGWQRWRIEVADATDVALSAVPTAETGPRSLVLLNQFSFCRISESHVELRCELRLDVHNQPRDQLLLELDPRLSLTEAQMAETPLEWHHISHDASPPAGEGSPAKLVVLDLASPLTDGPCTIELAAIAPLVTGEPWSVPFVRARDVVWQQSLLEIQVEGNLELSQLSTGNCQQIETSFSADPQGGERHKFQCATQRDEVTLELRRREAQIVGHTATRVMLGPTTMRGTLLATLAVERGLAFDVRGTIPAGWQIEEIESETPGIIDYWELQPAAEGAQSLLIRLREPLRAGPPLRLVLQGERRMPETRPFPLNELRMLELAGAQVATEHYYLGAESPSRPSLSGHALPVETVSQPTDIADSQTLGISAGDLSFNWSDFDSSRLAPQLELKADPVRFRYDATVTLRVQDNLLQENYVFACTPESAEVGTLLVQFNQERDTALTWTLGGDAESALTARKLNKHEQEALLATRTGEVWVVQLRRPRKVPFRLAATRSVPRGEQIEAALAALPEASPQNCEIRLLRETTEEFAVLAKPDLVRIPLTPPVELEYPSQIAAYRFQPERDLVATTPSVLSIVAAENSQFHLAWIRTLRLETLAFEGERSEHRVRCEIENYGARQLAFRLPPDVRLTELFIDGQPVPDAVGSDPATETMLALPANRRIVSVEFRMIGQSSRDLGRQRVTAPLPQFEAPVLDATWTLWCPPGREVLGLADSQTNSGLAEPGWRQRLFGPLARSTASLEDEVSWSESASLRRQVEWLLEDLRQAEAAGPATFWSYLARHVQSPPPGETSETRLPVLIDRATLETQLQGDPAGSGTILRRLGLAIVVHPQGILLTDPRCDWLDKECLRNGGRAGIWEIACDPLLSQVEQALQGSNRFVPVEQWNAEIASQVTSWRLAPAGWSAHWFELTSEENTHTSAEAILYRPASVQWLGWLGLLLMLPVISLLCVRAPAVAAAVVGVLGVLALAVPAWLVPITSLTLLGALGGVILWMTMRMPRTLGGNETTTGPRSHSTASLNVPSTIGTILLLALLLACLSWASLAPAQEPAAIRGARSLQVTPTSERKIERASVIYPLDENNEFSGPYVYVPEWYYQELFRRASVLDQEPGTWLLHTARYAASPAMHTENNTRDTIAVVANYELETLATDVEVTLPMPYPLLAHTEGAVQLDGRPLRVSRTESGDGLSLRVAIPGRHRLELNFALPIEENRHGRVAALPIPPLATAQLVWSGRGEPSMPESVTTLGGISERGMQQLEAELGPVSQLELQWPPQAVEVAGLIQTEQLLWLNVKPGSVVAQARFRVRTGEQEVSSLRLIVDRRLQPLPLPEETPIASTTLLGEGEREMLLEFTEPLKDEQTFDLSFLVRDAAGVGNLYLPRLALRGGRGSLRAVGISLDPTIAYVSHTGENLEPLAPDVFLTRWGDGPASPQWAFDLGAGDDSWSLTTQRRQPTTTGTAQLDLVCGAETIDLTYEATLDTSSGVVFQHRLKLAPTDIDLKSLSITHGGREKVARWTSNESGLLTVFLSEPISGEHRLILRASAPVSVEPDQNLPVVQLPTATLTNSEILVIRGYDATLRVKGGGGVEAVPNADRQIDPRRGELIGAYRVPVGSGQLLATIAPNKPHVAADSDLILEPLGEGKWQARWRCFLNVEGGQLDTLRLLVPADWEGNIEISQPGELLWSATASPERKLLTIYPREPWQGETELELVAPLTRRPSRPVVSPQLTLLEVDTWEPRLVVPRRLENLDIAWDLQNMWSVALPPHSAKRFADITRWNAYEATAEPFKAVHRTSAAPVGVPLVRLADIYVWWQQHGEGHGVARFDLAPAGNLACRVRAPRGCEIVAARVEAVPVNLTRIAGEDNLWELDLFSSQLPQHIEVVFQGQLSREQENIWQLIAPTLSSAAGDLQVEQTLWTVVGPSSELRGEQHAAAAVSLQSQQMARVESLNELIEAAETAALALPKNDTANWYALWARRLAVAQRDLMLTPPVPEPLSDADRLHLAEISQAQFSLADRLEIETQHARAIEQASSLPSEVPRWISLGRQLRPPQRYLFAGTQPSLQLAVAPPAANKNLQRMLALALWVALAAGCWALIRGAALASLAARWPGLLVVLAGILWTLWLAPFWLGVVLMVLGLWTAVRGERPPALRRQNLAR